MLIVVIGFHFLGRTEAAERHAALHVLGPDFRMQTGLYGHVRQERTEALCLKGHADPTLEQLGGQDDGARRDAVPVEDLGRSDGGEDVVAEFLQPEDREDDGALVPV